MKDRPIVAVSIAATTTTQLFAQGPARLMGWALREATGGATAACELYDGNDATGQSVAPFTFLANESVRDWLGPNGILLSSGAFLAVTAGSVRGSLWLELLPADAAYDALAPSRADVVVEVNERVQ